MDDYDYWRALEVITGELFDAWASIPTGDHWA